MADPQEAAGQPEGFDRPDWLEPNFTSVEAQAQSYAQARAEMSRAQNEARQAMEYAQSVEERLSELEEISAQPQQQEHQLPFNPLVSEFQQAYENGDVERQLQIQAFMASQIADNKIAAALEQAKIGQQQAPDRANTEMYALWADQVARERFDTAYGQGEWDTVRRDAAEYLQANPDLIPENLSPTQAADRLVMAAEYVQGKKLLAAPEQERNQYAQARQRRIMSQTLTSAGATPPTQETEAEAWARIQSAPAGSYSELRG